MTIDFVNKKIVTTKTEAIKASKINSNEYKELNELLKQYPTFEVVLKSNTTKRSKSSYDLKGLTYGFMEKYISIHGTEEQLNSFNELRFNTEMTRTEAASYGEIKKWFLDNFPQIKAASASKKNKGVA